MFRRSLRKPPPGKHRGVGLIAAIFLVAVIGALIVFLLRMSGLQHSSAALDVQGARAYQAARAGIEWGVYQALRTGACTGTSFGLAADLSDFTVTVTCPATSYTEIDVTPKRVFTITATACNRPTAGMCPGTRGSFYVERQLQALVDRTN